MVHRNKAANSGADWLPGTSRYMDVAAADSSFILTAGEEKKKKITQHFSSDQEMGELLSAPPSQRILCQLRAC